MIGDSPTSSGNWYLRLSFRERRTLQACFLGWALDAMDVQIYALVMPTLIMLWSLSKGQAGMIGTSALLVSSLGGWLAGILADRFGRARVLRLTIVWFAAFTLLSGFTNSYGQLILTRGLQGLGFGGEWVPRRDGHGPRDRARCHAPDPRSTLARSPFRHGLLARRHPPSSDCSNGPRSEEHTS